MDSDLLKPTNPKDRASTDRIDLSLFPQTALVYGALGMTEGDCKYGGYNYRVGGVLASVYVAALLRHVTKWYNGEETDYLTGVPHLASAIACLAILVDAKVAGALKDDRPPAIPTNTLFEHMSKIVARLHKLFPDGPDRYTQKGLENGSYNTPSEAQRPELPPVPFPAPRR